MPLFLFINVFAFKNMFIKIDDSNYFFLPKTKHTRKKDIVYFPLFTKKNTFFNYL